MIWIFYQFLKFGTVLEFLQFEHLINPFVPKGYLDSSYINCLLSSSPCLLRIPWLEERIQALCVHKSSPNLSFLLSQKKGRLASQNSFADETLVIQHLSPYILHFCRDKVFVFFYFSPFSLFCYALSFCGPFLLNWFLHCRLVFWFCIRNSLERRF